MTLRRGEDLARRAYSSDPENYRVAGAKPIPSNDWAKQVIERGETFVANDISSIAEVFPDHELIASLGCASVVNLPIRDGTTVIGSVNLLHEAGWYTPERVVTLESMVRDENAMLARACRQLEGQE